MGWDGDIWRGDPVFLPEVIRAEGLDLDLTEGCMASGWGDVLACLGILGHHTAGGGTNDWRVVKWGRADLPGPLAQLVLEKSGLIRLIAIGVCYHAGTGQVPGIPASQGNQYLIGIEAVSKGTAPWDWTGKQLEVYIRLSAAILRFLRRDASWFWGHLEYSWEGKIDPAGIDLNDFRRQIQVVIDGGPGTLPDGSKAPGFTPAPAENWDAVMAELLP